MSVCLEYQSVYCPEPLRVSRATFSITAAVFLLVALGLRIWIKVETTELGYELAALRSHTIELDMERREYELQLSLIKRPDNLARRALEDLDLVPLNPSQARKVSLN